MKQIFRNRYVKSFSFASSEERSVFVRNLKVESILDLKESYGENYYCYVCYDSLTGRKQFIITFDSEEQENDLSLVFWDEARLLVVHTGKYLYLINNRSSIIAYFDITTTLLGLYLTNGNNLLVLEEASFNLIDYEGQILKTELFDLIEDFSLDHGRLSIKTSEEHKIFELETL